MTMTLISTTTLASTATSLSVTSLPQTYTDLVITISARSERSGVNTDDIVFQLNGSTTNQFSRILWGTGSSAASLTDTQPLIGEYPTATATSNTFTNGQVYVPNYTGSTNKSFSADIVGENNATLAYATIAAGLYSSTDAITSFTLKTGSGSNLSIGTTVSVYGILKGSGGATVS